MQIHTIEQYLSAGVSLSKASKAMLMLHGRGASADSILQLSTHLNRNKEIHFVAPQATQYSWYPHSFLAPTTDNEPFLTSAIATAHHWLVQLSEAIGSENVFILGFSQGACLALETSARFAQRYAGVFGLSGGLIGKQIVEENYQGNYSQTPIYLGCSDADFHIPKERVIESSKILNSRGGDVRMELYPNMPHTITQYQVNIINEIIEKSFEA
ncbi:MAG: phospholipase [Cytophagales bacterium]|nr:MAG: phospholipase [Cytophagales bacterium]